jgi:hypothetical protein
MRGFMKRILALVLLFIVGSSVHAMDGIKTFAIKHPASESGFFDLFKKRVKIPYRLLGESELFCFSESSKRIRSDHYNHTFFSSVNPILILYVRIHNQKLEKQWVFLGNPSEFLASEDNFNPNTIAACTALIHTEKRIFNTISSQEMYLIELFEKIKTKLNITTLKQCFIEAQSGCDKQSIAVILKQNPEDSYLLLQDEQTLYFNQS